MQELWWQTLGQIALMKKKINPIINLDHSNLNLNMKISFNVQTLWKIHTDTFAASYKVVMPCY